MELLLGAEADASAKNKVSDAGWSVAYQSVSVCSECGDVSACMLICVCVR